MHSVMWPSWIHVVCIVACGLPCLGGPDTHTIAASLAWTDDTHRYFTPILIFTLHWWSIFAWQQFSLQIRVPLCTYTWLTDPHHYLTRFFFPWLPDAYGFPHLHSCYLISTINEVFVTFLQAAFYLVYVCFIQDSLHSMFLFFSTWPPWLICYHSSVDHHHPSSAPGACWLHQSPAPILQISVQWADTWVNQFFLV